MKIKNLLLTVGLIANSAVYGMDQSLVPAAPQAQAGSLIASSQVLTNTQGLEGLLQAVNYGVNTYNAVTKFGRKSAHTAKYVLGSVGLTALLAMRFGWQDQFFTIGVPVGVAAGVGAARYRNDEFEDSERRTLERQQHELTMQTNRELQMRLVRAEEHAGRIVNIHGTVDRMEASLQELREQEVVVGQNVQLLQLQHTQLNENVQTLGRMQITSLNIQAVQALMQNMHIDLQILTLRNTLEMTRLQIESGLAPQKAQALCDRTEATLKRAEQQYAQYMDMLNAIAAQQGFFGQMGIQVEGVTALRALEAPVSQRRFVAMVQDNIAQQALAVSDQPVAPVRRMALFNGYPQSQSMGLSNSFGINGDVTTADQEDENLQVALVNSLNDIDIE